MVDMVATRRELRPLLVRLLRLLALRREGSQE
jgi:hypothetical protein